MRTPLLVGCALALFTMTTGCPTSFTGSSHVQGGKSGCERKCKASGLRFSGMVFMGEYSTACICEPKAHAPTLDAGAPPPPAPVPPEVVPPAASDAGAPQAAAATGAAIAMMLQTVPDEQADPSITLYQLDRTIEDEESEPDEP